MIGSRRYTPQAGDIAVCFGADPKSRFISWRTYWPFSPSGLRFGPSHVAIMAPGHWPRGSQFWYESTTLCDRPCLLAGEPTSGVQVHDWAGRIEDYTSRGGKVEIYRLRTKPLDAEDIDDLEELLMLHLQANAGSRGELSEAEKADLDARRNVAYDMKGALLSGSRWLNRLTGQFGWFHDDVFCSDLLAVCLMALNLVGRTNPNSLNPGMLMRQVVRNGVYRRHYRFARDSQGLL